MTSTLTPKRRCLGCGEVYPDTFDYFYRSTLTDRQETRCKTCRNKQRAAWYKKWRVMALTHYSGGTPCCACCGETVLEFLALDHINGGGNEHRKTVSTAKLPKWLHDNDYPAGFSVLCHNCNSAHGYYNYCPHTAREAITLPEACTLLAAALGQGGR